MQRAERRITTIAGAGLIALLLAGCGDADPADGHRDDKPKTDRAASAGTPLPLDTAARQAKYTDSDEKAVDLKVAPTSVKRGTTADVAHVHLDDDVKGMVPHYLTVSVTNTGTDTVDAGAAADQFALVLADGTRGRTMSFYNSNPLASPGTGPLETCNGTKAPVKLPPEQTATSCQVVMLPKGAKPSAVSYSDDAGTRTWKVKGGDDADSGLLPVGKPAKTTWRDVHDKDFPLTVTPKNVRKVGPEALAGYDLHDDQKKADFYFVTYEYRNDGTTKLYPDMDEAVVLRTEAGRTVEKMTLLSMGSSGPKGCESAVPYGMVPAGKTVRQCGVYLLGKGDKPLTATFTPSAKGARTLTWKTS
ncbi:MULTISPECIES: hypothetical protein [unclassified Streptomyces]|uniref:hypothetical protein n=1 Tax=unclassified Streptomyces TaxID=2593676 RepID=UPI0033ED4651